MNNTSSENPSLHYHILNGDALKQRFPNTLGNNIIVARECLVDGNVQGQDFETLMKNRADFISQYPECSVEDYLLNTVPEFEKIIALPIDCEITCWFEDDLFCQVNFWFVLHLISKKPPFNSLTLVRPNKGNEYSFGHMSLAELINAFKHRRTISAEHMMMLGQLWPNYQDNNTLKLQQIGKVLEGDFPFLLPAVNAQIARTPDESGLGYPERVLLEIINTQNQPTFKTVFREFHHQMAIYSFGDLQVKAMYDRLVNLA